MALKPSTRYAGQVDTSDPTGYPHGKAQNIVVEGDGTGTPFEQDLVNDIFGFQQALLVAAAITPTNVPDKANASQYLAALKTIMTGLFGLATKTTVHTVAATGVPIPAEVVEIEVTVVPGGGGGSSGAGSGSSSGSCGGGSGKPFRTRIPRNMVGDTYDVTIGAGGVGGFGGLAGATTANVGNAGGDTSVKFIGPGNDDTMSTFVQARGAQGGQLSAGGFGYCGGGGAAADADGAGAGGTAGGNGGDGTGTTGRLGGVGDTDTSALASSTGAGCRGGAAGTPTGISLQKGGGGGGGPLGADNVTIIGAQPGGNGVGTQITHGGKGGFGYGAGGGGGGQGNTASGAGGNGAQGCTVVTFHYGAS